ncbi:MAG: cyclase family protein [Nitrososphaerota archaeon]|nr:cyclase family protein [Candidatus Bathyarchaeota archaeon]MDW8022897.1 cyclase family protein [Nitrososphaerota archaeon]
MNKNYRIIDLTHDVFMDMPSYPTLPPLKIEQIRTVEKDGSNVSMISSMHLHLGTHIDFPLHMMPGSKSSSDYTLKDMSGEGLVVDLSFKGDGEEITEEDLAKYGDQINAGDILFMFTGWSKKRDRTTTYLFNWPYLGESAAHFVVNKGVKLVGIDTLSIGGWGGRVPVRRQPIKSPSRIVHRILFEAGVLVVEEVANLDKVLMGNKVARGFFIIAPLAIKDVEASPCRVFMVSGL